eukprot:XP_001692457.1 predicted protein [Chlamydomonas reinhardtii]
MAPPAKSRKGKKAWRKNIDATEVEEFLTEQTYQQRRGPAAKELKDDQLFFVDTEVEAEEGGRVLTELERLQVEVDEEEDDEEEGGAAAGGEEQQDPNAIAIEEEEEQEEEGGSGSGEEEEGGEGGAAAAARAKKKQQEKKTKKDRNKEARRKALEAQLSGRKALRAQRRELQTLRDELKRQRLAALRAEKAAVEPPRLGKLRFEAPAVAVLTSDQKTGSLRQVVPCSMLAADRFKSLQQRGLVEPRKPQPFKERRRKVQYEKGGRFEKAEALSTEVREMGRVNKKARRAAVKSAAAGGGDDDWL